MNLSQEQKLQQWNEEQVQIYIGNDVLLIIYIFLGLIGNTLVIIVYKYKMKQNVDDRYFIPWLALLDLLACTFRCSFEFARKMKPFNFRGSMLCKLCWIPINITAFSSMILLFVIALHRYLKVCRPFGKQMHLNMKRVALGLTFGISVIPSIALTFYNDEVKIYNLELNVTGFVCEIDINGIDAGFVVFIVFATVFILIITSGLLLLNILIGRKIYKQIHFRMKMTRTDQSAVTKAKDRTDQLPIVSSHLKEDTLKTIEQRREMKKENISHTFSYMFMMVAIAFFLSYIPQFIILFMSLGSGNFWIDKSKAELSLLAIIREMNVLNNIVNPVIYGYYDKTFREKCIHLLGCNSCCLCPTHSVVPETR
ncbi:cholecystokinin receptor type A-like [Mytilus trossulus]|uniref:cholecystokinin receptor type A-like n=1 Tax=Mytilus trossulus TaxID=6551 RepID=UPI003005F7B9